MWFPITRLAVLACIFGARRCEQRSPLTLALYAWAILLVLCTPVFFTYSVKYSLQADAFIAACLCALTAAFLLVRGAPREAPADYEDRSRELRLGQVMGVFGIIGCVLLLADAQASGLQFSVGYLLDNLSRIRNDGFDKIADANNRGLVGTLGGLAAPCGVLCILAAVKLGRGSGRLLPALAVVNLALIVPVSLGVFGGRATIVNVMVLVFVSLYLSRRRVFVLKPRTVLIGVLTAIGVWYLATSWIETREQNASSIQLLEKTQRAKLSPWLNSLAQRDASIAIATVSFGYFASPLPTFHYYLRSASAPGPYYGAYSFPLPARFVGTIGGTWTRDQWYGLRQEIYAPISSRGYFDNVWATWPRDLLVDFGYLGSILFCGLFGAFMAWARNRFQMTGALHYHYFEVLATVVLGFGAFTSFMWDAFIAQAFYVSIALMFVVRARLDATSKNPSRTSTGAVGALKGAG